MKYSDDVMEIHNEFMTAGDTAVELANKILSTELKVDPKKIERLSNFGFNASKDATATADDVKEKDFQARLIEAVSFFRIKFPNYKFVPEKSVKAICEKYGLVSGMALQYKGFVPDKNLTEIERFFEQHPDMRETYWRKAGAGDGIISWAMGDVEITKEEFNKIDLANDVMQRAEQMKPAAKQVVDKSFQSFKKGPDIPIIGIQFLKARQVGRRYAANELSTYNLWGSSDPFVRDDAPKQIFKKDVTLRICAPASEMNTSGYVLRDGYKLIYDPIVSIEVVHVNGIRGEIVLTAWGDEASDELVINQNNN